MKINYYNTKQSVSNRAEHVTYASNSIWHVSITVTDNVE